MRDIHTQKLFALADLQLPRRVAQIQVPPRRKGSRLTWMESVALLASMRVVHAQRVFEFCTVLGITTLNLALNTPPGGSVLTLGLNGNCSKRANLHPGCIPFTKTHLNMDGMDFVDSEVTDRISALSGNLTSFDFGPWKNSIDLVFIEGGDKLDEVKSVTEKAFSMIAKDKLTCILWHNYRNAHNPDISVYLQKISKDFPMFHIEDTNLWVHFNDPQHMIQARLQEKGSGMSLAA